jgi:hypothetical protein
MCSSDLPLGVPNWVLNTHYQGGAAGREDAGGVRASPPIQLKAPCAVSTGGSTREKGGASGGMVVTCRQNLAP